MQKSKKTIVVRMKRAGVYAVALATSVLCVWFIMSPSTGADEISTQTGLNATIPEPRGEGIIGDMESAYRLDALLAEQAEKMRASEDTALLGFGDEPEVCDSLRAVSPAGDDVPRQIADVSRDAGMNRRSLHTSDEACLKLNRTLENFYNPPSQEKAAAATGTRTNTVVADVPQPSVTAYDEQVALLEKSYELAAKYMGKQPDTADPGRKQENEHLPCVAIDRVESCVVSSLMPPDSATGAEHRQSGFNTVVGTDARIGKNTVAARVHTDQIVTDGQSLKMRLAEDMIVDGITIPRNTPIVGVCGIQGERMFVSIVSLEIGGRIIPVNIEVYDRDGQRGIRIPDAEELSVAKDAVADAGQNLGTTVSVSNMTAGGQILSEFGKSAVQAASRYISGRMRVVKVSVKEGYDIMLYENKR
jgi:conjugative transposon TraM protein